MHTAVKRKRSRMSSVKRVDYFTGLPEPIIHHIMSFLPAKDVARIPMLSKGFKQLWSSFPIIIFNQKPSTKIYDLIDTDMFLQNVEGSIKLRQLDTVLQKFRLQLKFFEEVTSDSRVDRIIGFALENNVRELDLEIIVKRKYLRYSLMEGFSSRSIVKLNLNGLQFDCISGLISSCPLLKSLILTDCTVSKCKPINNNDASNRSLTILSFTRVNITDNWIEKCVPLFPNLKILVLRCCNELRQFRVKNENIERLEFIDSSSKVEGIEILAPKIRSLHLGSNVCVSEKWLKALISSLTCLEDLKLLYCRKLERIEIFSHEIKRLELLNFENIVEVSIDAIKLVSFVYRGNISAFKLMNSPRLQNPKLKPEKRSTNVEIYGWKSLRDSLSLFSHCEALTLECNSEKDWMFPEDIRGSMFPPLYDVKHLKIINRNWSKIDTELLDNFLWLSPHPETLCLVPASGMEKIVKFHYKKEGGREDICCWGLPLRCWRDDLEKVELQNFGALDDKKQLLKYFGQSAKFLEGFSKQKKKCNLLSYRRMP